MTNKVKVNGSWRSAGGLLVKVTTGGTTSWRVASKAFIKVAGTWYQWFAGSIFDTFTRTTNSNLGSADSGQPWNAIQGTWTADGSRAVSSNPSGYPIATLENSTPNAAQTIGNITNGAGAALWVTDSGNWFGAVAVQEAQTTYYTYSCGCSTCSVCTQTQDYDCNCTSGATVCTGGWYTYTYCGPGSFVTPGYYSPAQWVAGYSYTYSCEKSQTVCSVSGTCYSFVYGGYYISYSCCKSTYYWSYTGSCTGWSAGYTIPAVGPYASTYYCDTIFTAACISYTTYAGTCQTCTRCINSVQYSCGCSTCTGQGPTTYPAFVYVLKSVGNSVSRVVRTAISAVAQSMSVVTSNSQNVSVRVYSDRLTTQIDNEITYDAGSAQTATKFGIILSPSDYNQGTSLDDYSATTN